MIERQRVRLLFNVSILLCNIDIFILIVFKNIWNTIFGTVSVLGILITASVLLGMGISEHIKIRKKSINKVTN